MFGIISNRIDFLFLKESHIVVWKLKLHYTDSSKIMGLGLPKFSNEMLQKREKIKFSCTKWRTKKTTYISKNVFSLSIRTTEFIIGVTPKKIDKDKSVDFRPPSVWRSHDSTPDICRRFVKRLVPKSRCKGLKGFPRDRSGFESGSCHVYLFSSLNG